jgi:hypothetical protein
MAQPREPDSTVSKEGLNVVETNVLLREMEPIFSTVRDQYFTELIWLILK